MKNILFFLSIILIFSYTWSCVNKTSDDVKSEYNGIKSVEEFENLYLQQDEPFNKISKSTFNELKNAIRFDENNRFRGFDKMESLREDLNSEEMNELFNILSGVKMTMKNFPETDDKNEENN